MSNVTRRNFLLNSAVAVGGAAATLALATPAQAEESGSSEEDIYSGVLDEDGWRQLVVDVADEGIVLLKNNDSTLPFEKGAKLNLLGYGAYNPCYSGSGSGSVSADDAVSIVQSLEDAGFELNPSLEALYPAAQIEGRKIGWTTITLAHSEISIDSYTGDTSFESLKEYSENAVIVLGRSGGEAYDLIAFDGGDYLELAENEKALLEKACATFDHVVVVLNMANALEMDQLSTYDVDAMVWCGLPGPYGFTSLGRVLDGEVNPSGKLPDTWAMVRDSNPTWENFGDQQATNADAHYVDYVEGIYVGYKWYETAFAESAKITCVKTGNTFDFADYDSIVAYPFGYGLSYTTFDQKFSGTPSSMEPHGTLGFKVDVTNTGTVAGKQAVELYLSAPYTTYDQTAGIEKAAVELVGIAKTDLLEAGKSQTVTIQLDVEDLASYDSTHDNGDGTTGAYMLDAGDYVFSIRSDAHTSIEETTVSLGSDYFYSGSIDKRSSDVVQASNQFEDAARGEYLSRKNAFANYESAMKSVSPTVVSTAWQDQNQDYYSILDDEVTKTYQEGVDYAASGSLTMADVQGKAYDDPTWDELIKQLTVDEMHSLICDALYKTPEVASIQKAGTIDSDGPLGISSMFNTAISSIAYPCIPVLCATYNTTLAKQFGRSISAQAQNLGVTGWYAPAMDNHRSPYSGRNFEYYSEDGTLAAIMASAEVTGARSGGTIVYQALCPERPGDQPREPPAHLQQRAGHSRDLPQAFRVVRKGWRSKRHHDRHELHRRHLLRRPLQPAH